VDRLDDPIIDPSASLAPEDVAVDDRDHGRPPTFSQLDTTDVRLRSMLESFRRLDQVPAPGTRPGGGVRDSGRRPTRTEDPFNAVIRLCTVEGATQGPLAGLRMGVKDNIAVAGVPMTAGELTERTPTPAEDAVVVERLLRAGADVVAKTNIGFGVGAAPFGETLNPVDVRVATGGSSSGSAAAVASGLLDAALGSDFGGSVRRPAAWCGVVGLKPTQGLVPTHGLVAMDHSLDYIGPITTTVAQNAALLEVLAGPDWRDPSTSPSPGRIPSYANALDGRVEGMRIAVVTEALHDCDAETLRGFQRDRAALIAAGAIVTTASIPLWPHGTDVLMALMYSAQTTMMSMPGRAYAFTGRIDPELSTRAAFDDGSGAVDRALHMMSEHLRSTRPGVYPGHAQNLRLALRGQVEAALRDVDLLITPTTPVRPHPIDVLVRATHQIPNPLIVAEGANTRPLNLTGHPALSIPTGLGGDGLPTAVQLIGRYFDEYTLYRAGAAIEAGDPLS
jgi:amidase